MDNDTVLATGEEEGNGDSFTHSMYGKSAQLLLDIIVYYYNIFFLTSSIIPPCLLMLCHALDVTHW